MTPTEEQARARALEFTQKIVAGDFVAAHDFLTENAKLEFSVQNLEDDYNTMMEYVFEDGSVNSEDFVVGEYLDFDPMDDWAIFEEWDRGWTYVAITGDGFSEAVTLVFTGDDLKIRLIEWGRP